jgi:cytoskeletal protein RodZ
MSVSSAATKTNSSDTTESTIAQTVETQPLSLVRIGEILRIARESRNETLREAADNTKIRFTFLDNLENGEFDKLPGNVYALGFVRTYANYLGLDEHAVVATLKGALEFSIIDDTPIKTYDSPAPEGVGVRKQTVLLSIVVILSVIACVFYFNSTQQTSHTTVMDNKLIFSASADVKVHISLDQKNISERYLKEGQTMQIVAIDGLEIKTDTPDALSISLNSEMVAKNFTKSDDADMATMIYHPAPVDSTAEPKT